MKGFLKVTDATTVVEAMGWSDVIDEYRLLMADGCVNARGLVARRDVAPELRDVSDNIFAGPGRDIVRTLLYHPSSQRMAPLGYKFDGKLPRVEAALRASDSTLTRVIEELARDAPRVYSTLRSICALEFSPLIWERRFEECQTHEADRLKEEFVLAMGYPLIRGAIEDYLRNQSLVMRINTIGVCVTSLAIAQSKVGENLLDDYALTQQHLHQEEMA